MANDKNKILEKAKNAIRTDKEIVFIDDVVATVGISRSSFYELFPAKSDEMDTLKELLLNNKVAFKKQLRSKWYVSDNATLNICAYKLLSNEEERRLLADKQEIQATNTNQNTNVALNYLEFFI